MPLKDLAKGGWHPKNETIGVRRTIRKGISAGGGGGGEGENRDYSTYSAAPLSTLKDPASFGPPPKHVAIYGDDAGPGGNPSAQAKQSKSPAPPPASPSVPTRAAAPSPAPPSRTPVRQETSSPAAATAPRPPPRLPPRQNSHPDVHAPAPPPTYDQAVEDDEPVQTGYINTQAASRLGQAGVAVPGLNIGSQEKPQSPPPRQAVPQAHTGQMNELQARFARMGKAESAGPSSPTSPSTPSVQPAYQQFSGVTQAVQSGGAAAASAAAAKKAKPPPPRKKPELSAASPTSDESQAGGPPPIPLSSKPR